MTVGIHAQGFVGIAFETVVGTYVAPAKYFPVRSESMQNPYDTQWRRDIRGLADNLGAIKGYSHVEGDIEMYLMEDALPYFMQCMRGTVAKTGAGPDYTYTMTPTHSATGTTKPSMSVTVVRNGVTFGFVGCYVSQMEIGNDSGIPTMKFSIVGMDEASQSLPTPSWLATSIPFNVDQWSVEIPSASAVTDTTDVTVTVNDNASPQYRLINNSKAQFVSFGQREVTAKMSRDFQSRTEFDAFKVLTATSISFVWTKSASKKITFKIPVGVRETYELDGLSDQGTLHMAAIQWQGTYDIATSKAYEIVALCQENIV
jgi:hypothetical protein